MKRTYIQVKDNGGTWRLIVQVTEKASDNQREATHTICTAMMQDMGIGKEPLLATRKDILQWHWNAQWYPGQRSVPRSSMKA